MRSMKRSLNDSRKLVVKNYLILGCVAVAAGSNQRQHIWCAYNFWLLLVKFNLNLTFDVCCAHTHTQTQSLTLVSRAFLLCLV